MTLPALAPEQNRETSPKEMVTRVPGPPLKTITRQGTPCCCPGTSHSCGCLASVPADSMQPQAAGRYARVQALVAGPL